MPLDALTRDLFFHLVSLLGLGDRARLACCSRHFTNVARNDFGAYFSVDHMRLTVPTAEAARALFAGAPTSARVGTTSMHLDTKRLFWQPSRATPTSIVNRVTRVAPGLTSLRLSGMLGVGQGAVDLLASRLRHLRALALDFRYPGETIRMNDQPEFHIGSMHTLQLRSLCIACEEGSPVTVRALPSTLTSLELTKVDEYSSILELPELRQLQRLTMKDCADLRSRVPELSRLTYLRCSDAYINMDRLPRSLRTLCVEADTSDAEWQLGDGMSDICLTRLTNLRDLSLQRIYSTDDLPLDTAHLTGLTRLSSLSLRGFGPVDPSFLRATFPELEKLCLNLIPIAPGHPAVPPVPNAPLLRTLLVSLSALAAERGGEDVAEHDMRLDLLPRLERLVLVGARPDEASLLRLHGLRGLREVVLCSSEPLGPSGMLLAGLPNVRCVEWEHRHECLS